jgi:hypothetical protein
VNPFNSGDCGGNGQPGPPAALAAEMIGVIAAIGVTYLFFG